MKLYRRLMDDGLCVVTPTGPHSADDISGRMMNNFGYPGRRLEWTSDKPAGSAVRSRHEQLHCTKKAPSDKLCEESIDFVRTR